MGFEEPNGFAGDLGGGRSRTDRHRQRCPKRVRHAALGGLRLIDQTGGKIDEALKIADAHLQTIPWLSKGRGRPFYAVGGTWRALAKLHMEQTQYPLRIMQGYTIPTRDAIQFCESIRRTKKIASLPGIEEVARARREALPYGALVLERLLVQLQPSAVVLSVHGVREGLL